MHRSLTHKLCDRSALTHRWCFTLFLDAFRSELTCFNFDLLSACTTSIHNRWPEIRFDATDTNLLTHFMSVSPSHNCVLLLLLAVFSSSLWRSHSLCSAQLSHRFFFVFFFLSSNFVSVSLNFREYIELNASTEQILLNASSLLNWINDLTKWLRKAKQTKTPKHQQHELVGNYRNGNAGATCHENEPKPNVNLHLNQILHYNYKNCCMHRYADIVASLEFKTKMSFVKSLSIVALHELNGINCVIFDKSFWECLLLTI